MVLLCLLSLESELASQCMSDLLELQGPLLATTLLVLVSISLAETYETRHERLTHNLLNYK
jgi:hypothetical protein